MYVPYFNSYAPWVITEWLSVFLETRYQNGPTSRIIWHMSQLIDYFVAWEISEYIIPFIYWTPCMTNIVVPAHALRMSDMPRTKQKV